MKAKHTGVLLIELMAMLGIFLVCAAICLSLFVSSSRLSAKSEQLNSAAVLAENIAEQFKAVGGEQAAFEQKIGGSRLYFTREMQKTGMDGAYYTIDVAVTAAAVSQADIAVSAEGQLVYSLTVKCFAGVEYEGE